jgi:hypothetical protein
MKVVGSGPIPFKNQEPNHEPGQRAHLKGANTEGVEMSTRQWGKQGGEKKKKGRTAYLHRVRLRRVEGRHRGGPSDDREEDDREVDGGAHSG